MTKTINSNRFKFTPDQLPEWSKHIEQELRNCKDKELVIIKGHIMIEFLFNYFIEHSNTSVKFQERDFQFSQKVKLFRIFAKGDLFMIKEINLLNQMRNDIAHKLEYDNDDLYNFLRGMKKLEPKIDATRKNLTDCKNAVRSLLYGLAGWVGATIHIVSQTKKFIATQDGNKILSME